MPLEIRPARPGDEALILAFIRGIAEYERLAHEVRNDEALLREHLFGPGAFVECLLAFEDGVPAGFAIHFPSYSTFTGRRGLHLEDLFVDPSRRGRGIGRALLREVARVAVGRGSARMEWTVLDWNEPAIRFYESLGARAMSEWSLWRITGDDLDALAR